MIKTMRNLWVLAFLLISSTCLAYSSLIEAAQNAQKSVVSVRAVRGAINNDRPSAAIDPQSGQMIVLKSMKVATLEQTGAGVVIDPSGYIITNFHIIYLADKIGVVLSDNSTVGASVVHLMPDQDLALLKIDPPFALTPIKFANSDYVEAGDAVINIGHSDLLSNTLSGGYVTGIGRNTTSAQLAGEIELFRVNIDLYKGDSGGPLLNQAGEFIGMVSAEIKNMHKATLVIPSNKIKKLYQDFIK